MTKINYLVRRASSAAVDLLVFAICCKLLEPIFGEKNLDGTYSFNSGLVLILFYSFYLIQDIFFKKTIGKYLLKLELNFEKPSDLNGYRKYLKIVLRRLFDLIELVCPLIYILFIISTKNNQKLGDLISKITVRPVYTAPPAARSI